MLTQELQSKYQALQRMIADAGPAVVAFSGGVDSTLLLRVARDVLGPDRVLAATATSPSFPAHERNEAAELAQSLGVRHAVLATDEMNNSQFVSNSPQRCYFCKQELFTRLRTLAEQAGLRAVLEASNADDESDYRPGLKAVRELGVRSPLREARLSKADVRALSRELGLPTHDKPSFACLASRIPYGEPITEEKLRRIEKAEDLLRELGFRQFRVRRHGLLARIELGAHEDGSALLRGETRNRLVKELKALGYRYVALDLEGYRTGSMNEVLSARGRNARPAT